MFFQCWSHEPAQRPTFQELKRFLSDQLVQVSKCGTDGVGGVGGKREGLAPTTSFCKSKSTPPNTPGLSPYQRRKKHRETSVNNARQVRSTFFLNTRKLVKRIHVLSVIIFELNMIRIFFQQPLDFREEASAISFELEQRLLESRLRQQKLQSEQDSKWLQREENALKNR